jgi:hypothetical protein
MKPVSVLSVAVVTTFQVVLFPLAAQEPSIVMKDGGIEFPDGTVQETSAGPRTLTVAVNCSAAESINEALERKAEELIVEITGSCHEDVVIERNNVTLRGVTPGVTVVAASSTAIFLERAIWGEQESSSGLAPQFPSPTWWSSRVKAKACSFWDRR